MCGIVGYNFHKNCPQAFNIGAHRGPDFTTHSEFGSWTLGHNRLAIVDLNEVANQPFVSDDGRYILVFNGEIYNYQELKIKLSKKYNFKTTSDTEVVLYSFIEHEEKCLQSFVGMFSFLVYDLKKNTCFCAVDRVGIKPFNYYYKDGKFIFASEIKSILSVLGTTPEVNQEAVSLYLHYLYVPAPHSIFKDIRKLPPGHSMTISSKGISIKKYWNPENHIINDSNISEENLLSQMDTLMSKSVKQRMIADVPLGSFLSGGLDSSAILYYMAKHSNQPIKTYTLGFDGADKYDERNDAKLVAKHLGADYNEIIINPNITELLSKMTFHFDEPFGNPTSLLIHELTKETKKHVTVALAGDGGDEVFSGYPRYDAALLAKRLRIIPKGLKKIMASLSGNLRENSEGNHTIRRLRLFLTSLKYSEEEMYDRWICYYTDEELENLLRTFHPYRKIVKEIFRNSKAKNILSKTSSVDLQSFVPFNLMRYGDAMSMANGFEVRFPLLDHRIIELMLSKGGNYGIKGGSKKYLLKKLLTGKLPDQIINKPKLGLNPPMGIWLKKDLKHLLKDYLSKETIQNRGILNNDFVQRIISEHENGKRDRSLHLWSLIVLEEWFRKYTD